MGCGSDRAPDRAFTGVHVVGCWEQDGQQVTLMDGEGRLAVIHWTGAPSCSSWAHSELWDIGVGTESSYSGDHFQWAKAHK